MSLEKLVKEFAERVRAELLARINEEKNRDTATVKWQGFNDDGKPIIKNLDKTHKRAEEIFELLKKQYIIKKRPSRTKLMCRKRGWPVK